MQILPEEIDYIKSVGQLNGEDVKMIKTTGGFHVAIGKKSKSSKTADSLASGSHPALVMHQLESSYKKEFLPFIAKSEADQYPKVIEITDKMEFEDQTLKAFILHKSENFENTDKAEVIICKHTVSIAQFEVLFKNNTFDITNLKIF